MPSKYKNLSMVPMEAWLSNNAVQVSGNSEVLKGKCIKSNAGMCYTNYEEFRKCLNLLFRDSQLRERMGEDGRRYVKDDYE